MPPLEARRSERIEYRAPVELLAYPEGGEIPCRVLARTLDLGAGGMQLCAPVQMEVGASVTCRVELDGRPTALPGRVAWLQSRGATRHGDGHGMGIRFEQLGRVESELLRQVVESSSAEQRLLALHFSGIEEPVLARARAKTGGLRVSATLPILARGTELSFRLEQDGPVFLGRIGNAALSEEHGVRRLEIDVEITEADRQRFRRNARYGYASELETGADPAPAQAEPLDQMRDEPQDEPQDETDDDSDDEVSLSFLPASARGTGLLSRRTWLTMLGAAALGALCSWTVSRLRAASPEPAAFVAHPSSEPAEFVAQPGPADEPALQAEPSPPKKPPPAVLPYGAAEPVVGQPEVQAAPGSKHERVAQQSAPRATAPSEESPAAPAAEQPQHQAEGLAAMPLPELKAPFANDDRQVAKTEPSEPSPAASMPLDDTVQPTQASTAEPHTTWPKTLVEDEVTRVSLPFEGNLDGMRVRIWAVPHALAVDLPGGRTALALGRYPLGEGGATDLLLNARGDELLVRVKVQEPIESYTVTQADGALQLTLVRTKASPQAHPPE
jgi:hypothetical protein